MNSNVVIAGLAALAIAGIAHAGPSFGESGQYFGPNEQQASAISEARTVLISDQVRPTSASSRPVLCFATSATRARNDVESYDLKTGTWSSGANWQESEAASNKSCLDDKGQ